MNGSLALIECRNRFLSTPLDKAMENNQNAVVKLLHAWPMRLKRRNEVTDALRKTTETYAKDVASLRDTSALRALLREAEQMGRPHVKDEIVQEAKALLIRAGG
jgi:hypothetical protein